MGICESRKSCLTQLAYWFVLPKLLLPGQTLKKKSHYLRVKCWMQLMSTIFARNRMLAGLSEGLWRKSHKSLKTTAILKIPTIHQARHNRVLSEANAAFCAKHETMANVLTIPAKFMVWILNCWFKFSHSTLEFYIWIKNFTLFL